MFGLFSTRKRHTSRKFKEVQGIYQTTPRDIKKDSQSETINSCFRSIVIKVNLPRWGQLGTKNELLC